jgi:hypothetical protein
MLLGQRFPWGSLIAIVSPAFQRWRRALPDGAAPPDQVAQGFMTGVGHKDGRQLSGYAKLEGPKNLPQVRFEQRG